MRRLLLLCLLLAACSKGPQADLPSISEARSLGAEWALVNEQATEGKLTTTYVRTMRRDLREQLQTTSKSLIQLHSRYGDEIRLLLAEPDEAAPAKLRAHVVALRQIEDGLESA